MPDSVHSAGLLTMWLLVVHGGDALLKDIRPRCKPEHRRPLVQRGWVAETPEGRSKRLTLTDAGWYYLATHMTDPIASQSAATSGAVLQGILTALHRHMEARDFSLADIFSSTPDRVETPAIDGNDDAGDALWHRLAGRWVGLQGADEGIPLDVLRAAFGEVSRGEMDRTLLGWQRAGKIIIYPYDDGERVTPPVKAAALTVNGRDLHIIYRR